MRDFRTLDTQPKVSLQSWDCSVGYTLTDNPNVHVPGAVPGPGLDLWDGTKQLMIFCARATCAVWQGLGMMPRVYLDQSPGLQEVMPSGLISAAVACLAWFRQTGRCPQGDLLTQSIWELRYSVPGVEGKGKDRTWAADSFCLTVSVLMLEDWGESWEIKELSEQRFVPGQKKDVFWFFHLCCSLLQSRWWQTLDGYKKSGHWGPYKVSVE